MTRPRPPPSFRTTLLWLGTSRFRLEAHMLEVSQAAIWHLCVRMNFHYDIELDSTEVPKMLHEAYPRWWKYGRPADFWIKNIALVKDTIRRYKLKPVPKESLMVQELVMSIDLPAGKRKKVPSIRPKPFPGGIKIAHLHSGENIYLLSDEQWKRLSSNIVKGFREKLARVNTVTVEQVLEVSEAVDSLA